MKNSGLIGIMSANADEFKNSPQYYWDGMKRGNNPYVIVQLTHAGRGIFADANGEHSVCAEHAFINIIPEPARYYYPQDAVEPWHLSWIVFHGSVAVELWRVLREQFGPILSLPNKSAAALSLAKLINQTKQHKFKDPFDVSRQCYDFYLLCWRRQMEAARLKKTSLREVADFYAQQYHQPVTIKEMADQTGMTREHFSRLFRRELGMTPAHYLRQQRLRRAEDLLAGTDLPVGEIARHCGFVSPQQLAKTFRRERGVSPLAYRKNC